MKNLSVEQLRTLIISSILLVVGIMFCCSLAMGIDGLSIILGLMLLIVGIVLVIRSINKNKVLITTDGILGVVIISLGILFVVNKLASIVFLFIPWFLIVLGSILIIDSLLGRYSRNENNLTEFILKVVLGSLSVILGICLKLIDGFIEYASIILGVFMILYAIYIIVTNFILRTKQS